MAKKSCTICSDPEKKAVVDAMLLKHRSYKEIAKLTGIGRSSIGRHGLNCRVRHKAEVLKGKKFDHRTCNVFLEWPDNPGVYVRQEPPENFDARELRDTPSPQDLIIGIEFEPEVPERPDLPEPPPETVSTEQK
jgi:hypothetical protein